MIKEELKKLTDELITARSCCQELKDAANEWLKDESNQSKYDKYIEVLKDSIIPVDGLIAFCGSDDAKKKFGEDTAKKFLEHGKELKAKGAKYCDCPACAVVEKILKLEGIEK